MNNLQIDNLIDNIASELLNNALLSDIQNMPEQEIQNTLFNWLQNNLPRLLSHNFVQHIDTTIAIVNDYFVRTNSESQQQNINNYPTFELSYQSLLNIAFIIKKIMNVQSINSEFGSLMACSNNFNHVICFFIDSSEEQNLNYIITNKNDNMSIGSLWRKYKIKIQII